MAVINSTDSPERVAVKLTLVVQDLSIIRRLAQEIFDTDSPQAAADIASGIEALATRAGRAAQQCARASGGIPYCDWHDYPLLAITEKEVRHG